MKTKERNVYIDILKIIAILMVVVNHSLTLRYGFDNVVKVSVPIFLIITGYNSTKSAEEKEISFKDQYSKKNLARKFKRILIPFAIMVVVQIVLFFSLGIVERGGVFIASFLVGGCGDGGYYNFLMIQIILLMPVIQKLIKKYKLKAIFGLLFIQILFEILINLILPNTFIVSQIYRLCIIRQFLYLAFGAYIYYNKGMAMDFLAVAFMAVGILFHVLYSQGIYTPIIFKSWTSTTIPFGLMSMGIVYFAINVLPNFKGNKVISFVSNATFHIFLTQQTYCYLLRHSNILYNDVVVNVVVCFAIGLLFYAAQTYIEKLLRKRKRVKT